MQGVHGAVVLDGAVRRGQGLAHDRSSIGALLCAPTMAVPLEDARPDVLQGKALALAEGAEGLRLVQNSADHSLSVQAIHLPVHPP